MKNENVIRRTETLWGQKSKQVASCRWMYYLVIAATTTNLLITFVCQSSGHPSESHRAWCFLYTGWRYGTWPGDLTCRAGHNRGMEAAVQRERWWLHLDCFAAWLHLRLESAAALNSLLLQEQIWSSSESPRCAFMSLLEEQAGFLQSTARNSQAGPRRKCTTGLCHTSHQRRRNVQASSFTTDFVWLYNQHLLWISPCKFRIPNSSQPMRTKESCANSCLDLWIIPKNTSLWWQEETWTYSQERTLQEALICVPGACMSKPEVFKSAHMEKQRGEGWESGKLVFFQHLLVWSDGAVPAEV